MTGLGMTNLSGDLFAHGLLPRYSGPLFVGGAVSMEHGGAGGAFRLGLGGIKYEDESRFGRPIGMGMVELLAHWGDGHGGDITVDAVAERAVGRLLIGGGAGVAWREADWATPAAAMLINPEISLPLRLRGDAQFTPSLLVFARFELVALGRHEFDDKALLGASFVVW